MTRSCLRIHLARYVVALGITAGAFSVSACIETPRAAVSLRFAPPASAARDAAVIIDEEYIGPLAYVARHGVRLPVGEHRITVEKEGYFPYDAIVVADREPIHLAVALVPIPD